MTPEEITTAARRIALSGIQDQIDDRLGIGEQLEDELAEASETEWDVAVDTVRQELRAIHDDIKARWESR